MSGILQAAYKLLSISKINKITFLKKKIVKCVKMHEISNANSKITK